MCLWALAEHRALSHTLANPAGRRLARAAVMSAAKYREVSRPAAPSARGARTGRRRGAPPVGVPAGAGRPLQVAPGWTYDRVAGWTRTPDTACADGCAPRPG